MLISPYRVFLIILMFFIALQVVLALADNKVAYNQYETQIEKPDLMFKGSTKYSVDLSNTEVLKEAITFFRHFYGRFFHAEYSNGSPTFVSLGEKGSRFDKIYLYLQEDGTITRDYLGVIDKGLPFENFKDEFALAEKNYTKTKERFKELIEASPYQ